MDRINGICPMNCEVIITANFTGLAINLRGIGISVVVFVFFTT